MIDIHTHILPGLDDGAQAMDEAIQMARVALGDGINTVVSTPHGLELGKRYPRSDLVSRVEDLSAELARQGVELEVKPGIENYIAPDLVNQLREGWAFTLDGSRYLLVEFPMQHFPPYSEQVLFELQVEGVTTIIAHPERNEPMQRDHTLLRRLVERGMLAQVTAASLLGDFGNRVKRTAETFLRRNLVHIIASDAHAAHGHRAPVLSAAVAVAARLVGEEQALAMVTVRPQAILFGQQLEVEPPLELAPKKFWRFGVRT